MHVYGVNALPPKGMTWKKWSVSKPKHGARSERSLNVVLNLRSVSIGNFSVSERILIELKITFTSCPEYIDVHRR